MCNGISTLMLLPTNYYYYEYKCKGQTLFSTNGLDTNDNLKWFSFFFLDLSLEMCSSKCFKGVVLLLDALFAFKTTCKT